MSRTALTVTAAAVLCEKVNAEAVCFEPDGVCDAVVSGVAFAVAAALKHLPLTEDVAPDNPTECLSELPYPVGVDEGVHHGVGMRQDDGHVNDPERRTRTMRTEKGEAVDDV